MALTLVDVLHEKPGTILSLRGKTCSTFSWDTAAKSVADALRPFLSFVVKRITQSDLFLQQKEKSFFFRKSGVNPSPSRRFFQHSFSNESIFIRADVWRDGVLSVSVESAAVAMRVYALSEDLLEILRNDFLSFVFEKFEHEYQMRKIQANISCV